MNKRKLLRRFFGITIIVVGICLCLYPIINQAIAQNAQDTLLEEIYAIMDAQNKGTPTPTPVARMSVTPAPNINEPEPTEAVEPTAVASNDKAQPIDKLTRIDEEFNSLLLSEQEVAPTATVLESERLRGQKLFGIIQIPKIDLTYAIVEGTSDYNIGVAIGHFSASVAIGAEGNCALAGHRGGTSGPYFKDIDELEEGDEIIMTDMTKTEYVYTVIGSFVVEPTDTYVVKDLEKEGQYLTLVTCTQNGTKRLIVRAKINN